MGLGMGPRRRVAVGVGIGVEVRVSALEGWSKKSLVNLPLMFKFLFNSVLTWVMSYSRNLCVWSMWMAISYGRLVTRGA